MKICLINNLYPPYERGGAEKVSAQMVKNLKAENHNVFIITTKPKFPDLKKNENDKIFYIKSDFFNLGKKSIFIKFFWHLKNLFSFYQYKKILEILNKEKPDLVISHNLIGLGFLTTQAIKLSGAKHHHFLHDIQLLHPSGLIILGKEQKINYLPAKLYRFFTKKIMGSPDLIISPSYWLLKEHQKRGFFPSSKIEIRPFAQNTIAKTAKKKNIKKLLFAGQIEKHKGVIFLINAFKNLAAKDMILQIAGNGNLLEKAKKIAKEDKRIIFLGNLNKQQLNQIMMQSDALVVPSLCYENSPLIITEAKEAGLKIIASNLGGIPETISETDSLFTPNSMEDLFKKINNN
jgi:glycosyltransferase involved in cell wall biosynthesis